LVIAEEISQVNLQKVAGQVNEMERIYYLLEEHNALCFQLKMNVCEPDEEVERDLARQRLLLRSMCLDDEQIRKEESTTCRR
jgi:hypothetical protein